MKTVSSLYRNERQREFSRCLSIARQTEENAANIAEETALVVAVPSDGTETDVWAEDSAKEEKEEDIFHSSHLHEHGAEDEDIVTEQEQGAETNKEEELNDTLKDFLDCIKQVKGTVTEDVQAVSRELAKHSVGVTSAKSFAELQHHVNEIVQLSGPEVSITK
ncbi:uncharacterized protein EMH_0000710 [Eimeria mitis]|uniref:Uncharacterized protein n=1 Tax=Eimeria mitis TaxID=44415 RepID=U6KHY6_9EIME|nr:uncharacterized protein EMH_0000710 [Eimeria mitis]CDJ35847.1 hypothetical protein, conserved [Eimeria mitis]